MSGEVWNRVRYPGNEILGFIEQGTIDYNRLGFSCLSG
jgi:hypothetical protein